MQSKRRGRAGKMLLVRFCEFGPLAYPRLDRSAQYPKFWPSGEPGTVLLKYCRYLFSEKSKIRSALSFNFTFSSSFSSTLSSSWFLSKWLLSTNFRPFRNLTLAPGGKSFPTECNTIVTISEFWEYRQISDIVVRIGLKKKLEIFNQSEATFRENHPDWPVCR